MGGRVRIVVGIAAAYAMFALIGNIWLTSWKSETWQNQMKAEEEFKRLHPGISYSDSEYRAFRDPWSELYRTYPSEEDYNQMAVKGGAVLLMGAVAAATIWPKRKTA